MLHESCLFDSISFLLCGSGILMLCSFFQNHVLSVQDSFQLFQSYWVTTGSKVKWCWVEHSSRAFFDRRALSLVLTVDGPAAC